jgi:glycosyltransferase involved in cell wall biosynthesis
MPEWGRPDDSAMFRWQDTGFDGAVARILSGPGFIHGLPGQCLEIFRRAKELGMVAVLNHASGPFEQQRRLVAPEYERVGMSLEDELPVPQQFRDRLAEEWALADIHCVASSVVQTQLVNEGVSEDDIWIVPYGADSRIFRKRETESAGSFRICFAGRQSLRKGIHYLLKALEAGGADDWELHCLGMELSESRPDFEAYSGAPKIIQHGSVPQSELSRIFSGMNVLVLPSAEEAFGLVVVQALECGIPCIVSDRVGAKDLVRDGETGSIVPFGDMEAISKALLWWNGNRITVNDRFPWSDCAKKLLLQAGEFLAN